MSPRLQIMLIIFVGLFFYETNAIILNIIDVILGKFLCKRCVAPDGTEECCERPSIQTLPPDYGCPPPTLCSQADPILGFGDFCNSNIDCRGTAVCCLNLCLARRVCTLSIFGK